MQATSPQITPKRAAFTLIELLVVIAIIVEEDRETIDDSRWVPENAGNQNLVSPRHNGGKGNVIFADGHLQAVTPAFGQDPTNSCPTL